ncbi:MAG: chemotaxis protein CheA [Xanthomonadales bacterium]|nr:chemotaxis protein CheA [Xanthomonadales bacterium]MDZ4115227.1 chemotaxis protein CheA [Xanthomonadaceae bacterium]MDZ4377590.1 chemotaxis protein CheA [Xanthomonadaceae bacterium]
MSQVDLSQFHQTFFDESLEGLDAMESALLKLDTGAADSELVNTIFRAAHSIKGGSATFGFQEIAAFTHVAEELLDGVRSGKRAVTVEVVELLLRCVDALRGMLERAKKGVTSANQSTNALLDELRQQLSAVASNVLPSDKQVDVPPASDETSDWVIGFRAKPGLLRSGNDPLRMFRELADLGELDICAHVDGVPALDVLDPEQCYIAWDINLAGKVKRQQIDAVFDWADGDCELTIARQSSAIPGNSAIECSTPTANAGGSTSTGSDPVPIVRASEKPTALRVENAPSAAAAESGSIRVSIDKVDALINMVGELVITQSMLGQLGEHFDLSRLEALRAGLNQLERNTRELQESVMRIRMLPISVVFQRFPRLVRDISRKLGKQVNLELHGEQTELDKTVLEKIGDPLVHLVRNAVDHGLEMPDRRVAAGKNPTGTLRLDAFHQGGNITVEVSDDGAGLNRDAIARKAIERGLITSVDGLTDDEVAELIFQPGFSTAEATTDLSGRGVGMDVVRRNVNELGGTVGVQTKAGAGSVFTITLPLTLAIIDGLTAAVGGESYIVPLVSVVESLQIKREQIIRLGAGREVFRFREEVLPIIPLHAAFGCQGAVSDPCDGIVIVVEGDGARAGLLVDALLGQQQAVIKSLETNYKRVQGLSGATILGDGSIALIVDVAGLVRLAHRKLVA